MANSQQSTDADMRAFGASHAACYKWPDDTPEHKALRAAYIEGAANGGGNTNPQDRAYIDGRLVWDSKQDLADEVYRLRRDCAELYQVIGTMAEHMPVPDAPNIVKALDNASAAADGDPRPHDDLLPFVIP